jgi:hypothetical protein
MMEDFVNRRITIAIALTPGAPMIELNAHLLSHQYRRIGVPI